MDAKEGEFVEHKAYARIGFLGNPSDVYNGKTISISISNFWASVRLVPSDRLVIMPHPVHDLVEFDSLNHLVSLFVLLHVTFICICLGFNACFFGFDRYAPLFLSTHLYVSF